MLRAIRLALLAACPIVAGTGAGAATIEYALELPAHQRLSYGIEFEVAFPGRVRLDARWSPGRVLVFRIDRPGEPPFRRSGPSPQVIDFEVAAGQIADAAPWTLSISGLPSRDAAQGRLRIELPDSPAAVERHEEAQRAAEEPPAPAPDPWTVPVDPPRGLGRDGLRLYEATESFRRRVVEPTTIDAYRWQDEMLRFLAGKRDLASAAEPRVSRSSSLFLERLVAAVRELDRLRQAENRPLSGPEPTDAVRRRAWSSVRDPRFEPLEQELDALLADLHGGLAPELAPELWLTNYLSCVIVCQRHFEARARGGREPAATLELVRQQWDTLVAAADALEALVGAR